MPFELPGWVVVLLWIVLALAGLAILVSSSRSTLDGISGVLDDRERDGSDDDGDSVGDDHDRGAPER